MKQTNNTSSKWTKHLAILFGGISASVVFISLISLSSGTYAQSGSIPKSFQNPEAKYRPHMRMWIPQAAVEESVLRAQIDDLANAGVGDIELVAFDINRRMGPPAANATPTKDAVSNEIYGWGTPNWTKTMEILLDQAGKRGIKATFTIGPAWPVASPLLKKTSPGVEVQLGCTKVDLSGNAYSGEVTGNINKDGVSSKLVAVVAGKRASSAANAALDINTLKDLTGSEVRDKNVTDKEAYIINWTAPDESGQWTLYFYWCEPVGEIKSGCYVVDHFSMDGTKAVLDYYAAVYKSFAQKNLLQFLSGLFGDSLEYMAKVDWTPSMLEVFRQLKGYDLTPYLPAINNGLATGGGGIFGGGFGQESLDGLGTKIKNDYYDVLTYLFNENHLKPIQKFLDGYGQTLRYQTAYGKRMEQASTSMNVAIPEGEMMMIRDAFDNIRAQAGAVHMTDKIEYNAELQAEGSKNHAQSWENLLFFIQRTYAAGVNNTTLHGYNYSGAFNGPGNVNGHTPGVTWPGWEGFGRDGYSNSWGTEPLWKHAKTFLDFMARNSYILKQGNAKIDLAVFRESFWDNASFAVKDGDVWYKDGGVLQDLGYSYDFLGLPNLKLPNATVKDARLDADGPAYKALILDQSLNTANEPMTSENKTIGLEAAKKILELAKAGLPVVYIGEIPGKSTYYNSANLSGTESQIQSVMTELKGLANVKQAKTVNDVPAALASLKLTPDAKYSLYSQQSKLINIHRAAEGIDYYYVYNRGFNSNSGPAYQWNYGGVKEQTIPDVAAEVSFKASGTPCLLNTWTGEITPIASYTTVDDRIIVPLSLKGNESTIVAFDHSNVLGTSNNKMHSISSLGNGVCYDDQGNLAVKATSNGTQTIRLSDGSVKSVEVAGLPAPMNLGNWKLKVEDWKPGSTLTTTSKEVINVALGDLKPWHKVLELQNASGIGTYTTSFTMPKGWNEGVGAYLNLGIVNFAYKLKINGKEVKTSQVNTLSDIGPYIKSGTNTIEVEVATTLNNRLKDLYNVTRRTVDYYGLLGSGGNSAIDGLGGVVTVTPYVVTLIK